MLDRLSIITGALGRGIMDTQGEVLLKAVCNVVREKKLSTT